MRIGQYGPGFCASMSARALGAYPQATKNAEPPLSVVRLAVGGIAVAVGRLPLEEFEQLPRQAFDPLYGEVD